MLIARNLCILRYVLVLFWIWTSYCAVTITPEFGGVLAANTKAVVLNFGSSFNPVDPPPGDDSVSAIAFEPLIDVCGKIERKERLHLVCAAVSDRTGMSVMHRYNSGGISSSLAEASYQAKWNDDASRGDGEKVIVPTLSFTDVLNAIPRDIHIWYLKTDMQGYDLQSLKSAGEEVRRIHYIKTEVMYRNLKSFAGSDNDFCRHWIPYMTYLGYDLVAYIRDGRMLATELNREGYLTDLCVEDSKHPEGNWLAEGDAFWVLRGTTLPPPTYVGFEDWPSREEYTKRSVYTEDFVL
jgi:FkbM family methyltransferase